MSGPNPAGGLLSPKPSARLSRAAASSSQGPLKFSPGPCLLGLALLVPAESPPPRLTPELSLTSRAHAPACREVGLFLRRVRDGEHRGASGRDRLPGASRYWVVVRDCRGAAESRGHLQPFF